MDDFFNTINYDKIFLICLSGILISIFISSYLRGNWYIKNKTLFFSLIGVLIIAFFSSSYYSTYENKALQEVSRYEQEYELETEKIINNPEQYETYSEKEIEDEQNYLKEQFDNYYVMASKFNEVRLYADTIIFICSFLFPATIEIRDLHK